MHKKKNKNMTHLTTSFTNSTNFMEYLDENIANRYNLSSDEISEVASNIVNEIKRYHSSKLGIGWLKVEEGYYISYAEPHRTTFGRKLCLIITSAINMQIITTTLRYTDIDDIYIVIENRIKDFLEY